MLEQCSVLNYETLLGQVVGYDSTISRIKLGNKPMDPIYNISAVF